MAKGMYIGVGGVAKKVKRGYIGVGGVSRKLKKAYIGISSVARLLWSSGGLPVKIGKADNLSYSRYWMGSANVGNYLLFAGGRQGTNRLSRVDAYDTSLTRTSVTAQLSIERAQMMCGSIGSYAIFAGGNTDNSNATAAVDAYNSSLTRTILENLPLTMECGAAAKIGNFLLLGGGDAMSLGSYDGFHNTVYTYNTSLTRGTATGLSVARTNLAAGANSAYAIFAGGKDLASGSARQKATVDAYNASLTRSQLAPLSRGRSQLCAGTNGIHVIFSGGYVYDEEGTNSEDWSCQTEAYDKNGTRVLSNIGRIAAQGAATGLDGYAIFAGGLWSGYMNICCAYDNALTCTDLSDLTEDVGRLAAGTVGNYALFAGGLSSGGTYHSVVNVYGQT